jgi:pimeloyl-ACP methyl ester carboxylesterase
MYKAALRLLCVCLFLTGAFTGTSFAAPGSHEKVYLLRGFMNVFSLGMDQLASELEQRGISATVGNHLVSGSFASDAIQACKSGQINSIVIIGHSLGASAAVSMAEEMQKAGVRVALIVTFDPVVRTAVPPNVLRLKNFYFSNGVGAPVARGEHFHGLLQNVDMKDDPQLGHVSLAYSPAIHRQVLEYIAAAANSHCR